MKMNIKSKRRYYLHRLCALAMSMILLISCDKDWDDFKKYTEEGEIIYPGKFESAEVLPGKERIRLVGELTADPKVTKVTVYWNNDQDFKEFDIDPVATDFTFDQIIEVEEGTKSFTMYTHDEFGNTSVASSTTGKSYGDRYRNTLSNRRIKAMEYEPTTKIIWDIVDQNLGPVEMVVTYPTATGDKVIVTPANETETILEGLDYENDGFTWRTVFKPEEAAIDTFMTSSTYKDVPVFVEKELSRDFFAAVSLTGDTYSNGGAGGVDAMWDGSALDSYGGALFTDIASGGSSPQMATFDLGTTVKTTEMVIFPFREWWGSYYIFSTIRDYEIYGSANPSASGELDASWTLLASGTIEKPSGLEKDNETDADRAAAEAGFSISLNPDAPAVRYIRIRCLKNYDGHWSGTNSAFFSVAEVYMSGMVPE